MEREHQADVEVIELGTASVETRGSILGTGEPNGRLVELFLSDD